MERSAATGSARWLMVLQLHTRSKVASLKHSLAASACTKSTVPPPPAACRWGSDRSTPTTCASLPSRLATMRVAMPTPHPTSSTRARGARPSSANTLRNSGAMKRANRSSLPAYERYGASASGLEEAMQLQEGLRAVLVVVLRNAVVHAHAGAYLHELDRRPLVEHAGACLFVLVDVVVGLEPLVGELEVVSLADLPVGLGQRGHELAVADALIV